jgi:hypothetical protein
VTIVARTLSLAVVVLLLGACSGGGKKTASAPGSTAPTAQDEKAGTPLDLKSFTSPSGNIGCMLESSGARCDVRQRVYTTGVKPGTCNLDWGDSLQVSGSGTVEWVCHGDTVVEQGAPVLPYGKSSRQGSVTCASADTGVTCTQRPGGHGFLISRERYRIF